MQLIDNQDSQTNYTGIFNFFFKEKEGQSVNNQETKVSNIRSCRVEAKNAKRVLACVCVIYQYTIYTYITIQYINNHIFTKKKTIHKP